jgi:predicted acetyltransferase
MQATLTLRRPTEGDEQEVLRAHLATSLEFPSFLRDYQEGMPFRRYLEVLEEHERGVNLPSGHVHSTLLFAFNGATVVGRVSIRHSLNELLERQGGHIGYVVVPEFRRQGYGTMILRLSLQIARDRCRTRRLLVTCDEDNIASIRTIEKNGGVLGDVITGPDLAKPTRRYWFELA